jgi:hypothetical protein
MTEIEVDDQRQTTVDKRIPGVEIEPSQAAILLSDTIMRRIKKGLDATGVHIDPQFTGLSQLIEIYLIAARAEGRAGR